MAESTITVPWPRDQLTPEQWRRRMTDLAEAAEAMVGRRTPLQQQAQLAMWWLGLCWSGFSPETIAASCRASLLVGENVVAAASPGNQLQEIAERLHRVWEDAQSDPSAAVAKVGLPVLDLPPRDRGGRRPGPKPQAPAPAPAPSAPCAAAAPEPPAPSAAAAPEPDDDPDELPAAWRQALEPEVLEVPDAAVLEVPAPPAAPAPEPSGPPAGFASATDLAAEIGVRETAIGAWATRNLAAADIHRRGRRVWFRRAQVIDRYIPRSERPRKPAPPRPEPPEGWFSTRETIELVGINASSMGRWRKAGRFGSEGAGWMLCRGVFYFAPEAVERVMEQQQPAALDELLNEIRAA